MKSLTYCLLLLLIVMSGCKKAKFVLDAQNGDLPAYTEKGNNIAGALIDGDPWISKFSTYGEFQTTEAMYIANTFNANADSTIFEMQGPINKGALKENYVYLKIIVKGLSLNTPDDLLKLNNRDMVIDGVNNYVILNADVYSAYYRVTTLPVNKKGSGHFYIKHMSVINGINSSGARYPSHPIILSGTFDFDISTTKITSGRFDIEFDRPFGLY